MEQNIEEQTQSPEENKETRSVFIGAKVTPGQKEYIKAEFNLQMQQNSD